MRERKGRIAVGLDDSPAAREALVWAAREAAARRARLLVVTAWTAQARAAARDRGVLREQRLALQRMQREVIAAALGPLADPPPVARELVLADPITALAHAAEYADLLVVGDGRRQYQRRMSTATLLARRLGGAHGRADRIPVVAVPAERVPVRPGPAGQPPAPAGQPPAPAGPTERVPVRALPAPRLPEQPVPVADRAADRAAA